MNAEDRATLAHMVIGEERRSRLIERLADFLAIQYGMPLERARRYAENPVNDANAAAVLAVGQVWSRADGRRLPGDDITSLAGRTGDDSYTVYEIGRPGPSGQSMARVSDSSWVAIDTFDTMWLTSWPDTYTVENEPYPLADSGATLEELAADPDDEDEEGGFDAREVGFLIHRVGAHGCGAGEGIPLLSAPYRAVNWKKPEYEPSYGNLLDVPAYLAEHLADYRAGWPGYRDRWDRRNGIFAFNEMDGGCECEVVLAAYIGWWLVQRVRADTVAEYGGLGDDYEVLLMWSPGKADLVLEAAPYADPGWEIPADHPLSQCGGQTELLGDLPAGGAEGRR